MPDTQIEYLTSHLNNLQSFFDQLKDEGIITETNKLCCGGCLSCHMCSVLEKEPSDKKYICFHSQDMDRAFESFRKNPRKLKLLFCWGIKDFDKHPQFKQKMRKLKEILKRVAKQNNLFYKIKSLEDLFQVTSIVSNEIEQPDNLREIQPSNSTLAELIDDYFPNEDFVNQY